jgi:glycerate-2-kinase
LSRAIIKNRASLEAAGDLPARKMVLEIMEAALRDLNAHEIIRRLVRVEGDTLRIGNRCWGLANRRVIVLGAGKAANAMARGVEEALGDRISEGLVIVKQLEPDDVCSRVELAVGGHPLPNADGLRASRRILEIARRATPEDLFVSVISGGSSALMSCPRDGISLEDERQVTDMLLKTGASILEINAVRRHISATNGGRLAQIVEARGAEMINLIISDSLGAKPTTNLAEPVRFLGTPVAPDGTTLHGARATIDKYRLSERIPRAIRDFLWNATPCDETPKTFGDRIHQYVLERPANACLAVKRAAGERNLSSFVLTTTLEGESSGAGGFLGCIAREATLNGQPVTAPCLLIAGGETTTRIDGPAGEGGPSQELALGFAGAVAGRSGVCLCALDTDGTDGPTQIAGGLVDGTTAARARAKGFDLFQSLLDHDSSPVLRAVGDAVVTGNTGTNVCDLNVVYISGEKRDS